MVMEGNSTVEEDVVGLCSTYESLVQAKEPFYFPRYANFAEALYPDNLKWVIEQKSYRLL